MIRAFLAIRPADQVIESLVGMQSTLADAGADVRWVAREALHLTVHFLGNVGEPELPEIERGLREGLATVAPFDSVHSVIPVSGRSVVLTIVPAFGFDSISFCPAVVST